MEKQTKLQGRECREYLKYVVGVERKGVERKGAERR